MNLSSTGSIFSDWDSTLDSNLLKQYKYLQFLLYKYIVLPSYMVIGSLRLEEV